MAGATEWATVAVTLILGIAGFFVAGNIRSQVRLRLAERRLVAYERLWALMRPISPYSAPMDEKGRQALHEAFTDWYYANGDGMLIDRISRIVYLEAKDNLIRPLSELTPAISRERIEKLKDTDERDRERGLLSQRQLSLLRTQLKTDLAIFGRPYRPALGDEDRAFLVHCGVRIDRRPWKDAS